MLRGVVQVNDTKFKNESSSLVIKNINKILIIRYLCEREHGECAP